MRIVIGADIAPTTNNIHLFESGEVGLLIDKQVSEVLNNSDYRVFNLETPIVNTTSEILKWGPCLSSSVASVKGFKSLNIDLFTLANNHIMDQGGQGLRTTMDVLKNYGIDYLGVGKTIEDAAKPFFISDGERKIGFYACAEHEFSIVDSTSPGANPYDPLVTFDSINNIKRECDFLIVLYHGGKECYRYPTPMLQRSFRKMADSGADLVIAQHTHCVGSYEEYNGSTLVYGQGNFIFDSLDNDYWNSGLLIEITIEEQMKVGFVPLVRRNSKICVDESGLVLSEFLERSQQIIDESFVRDVFHSFSQNYIETGLRVLHGNNLMFKILNKIVGGGLIFKMYSKHNEQGVLNFLECESQRETIIDALKQRRL